MSGGCLNYLYAKDAEQLLNNEAGCLDNLSDAFNELEWSKLEEHDPDTYKKTKKILDDYYANVMAMQKKYAEMISTLNDMNSKVSPILRAIEWCGSNDSDWKDIQKSTNEYLERSK